MQGLQSSSRKPNRTLLWIALVAFVVRLAYILINPRPLVSDQLDYQSLASNLATHFTYAVDSSPTAFRPVGYPAFVALVYVITGVKPLALKILQALCDAVVILVLPRIVENASDKARIFIAWGWAFFPPAILYTNLVMSESVYATLLVVACLLYVRHDSRSLMQILLGIVFGLLTLMRPDTLLLFVVLMIVDFGFARARRRVLIASAVFVITLTPWVVRNTIEMGTPTISTYSGINLLIGNNANANGGYTSRYPKEALDTTQGEVSVDRQATRLAAEFVREHPAQSLLNAAKKYAQFFSSESYLLVTQFATESLDSPTPLAMKYASVSPIAFVIVNGSYAFVLIAGWIAFFSSRKNRGWYFFAALLVTSLLVHIAAYGGSRYHYPLMPFLVLYGLQCLVGPREKFSGLHWWRKTAIAVGILSFVGVWGTEMLILIRK